MSPGSAGRWAGGLSARRDSRQPRRRMGGGAAGREREGAEREGARPGARRPAGPAVGAGRTDGGDVGLGRRRESSVPAGCPRGESNLEVTEAGVPGPAPLPPSLPGRGPPAAGSSASPAGTTGGKYPPAAGSGKGPAGLLGSLRGRRKAPSPPSAFAPVSLKAAGERRLVWVPALLRIERV